MRIKKQCVQEPYRLNDNTIQGTSKQAAYLKSAISYLIMAHRIKFLLLLTLFFTKAGAQSQQKDQLLGIIADAVTKNGIEGATVHHLNTGKTAITDASGHFKLQRQPLPADSILVSAIGFESKKFSINHPYLSTTPLLLNRSEVLLSEVVVATAPNLHNRIISKIDIQSRSLQNAQEVLRMVRGLFIGQHAGGGKAEQIFLRGFDIDHGTDIALSVDGVPVNMVSHAHGQGYADLHFLIPELIEEVQFKKGTYYPEKGNFATTGFVDFKTIDILQWNSIKVEGGMFNTLRTVGLFNLLGRSVKEKSGGLYIGTEYLHTQGYFDHPQDFNRFNIFSKYHTKIGSKNTLSASASYFNSWWNASGQIPVRAVASGAIGFFGAIDPYEGGTTSRANANLQLTTVLNNLATVKNQVYFTTYDFLLYSNFTFYKNDSVNGDQIRQKEHRQLTGYNGSYAVTNYTGIATITSEAGINLRVDQTWDSELSRTISKTKTAAHVALGDIREANLAAYLNETFRFSNRFSASAGLRYDYFINKYVNKLQNHATSKTGTSIISPKLNLQYNINSNTILYVSAGKGFHANDTRAVVAQNKLNVLPPAYGADAGITIKPLKNLFINTALWYLWLDQEFIYVGDEGIVEPGGRTRRLGMDLSARYQPLPWLLLDVDANYARPRSVDAPKGEGYLPLAPLFTSAGGLTIKTKKGFNGSWRYRYMSNRPANEDYSLTARGYFVADAMLNYSKQKVNIGISVQNLFDVRWKETQFETESRLFDEANPVTEIHFTPGTPFFLKASLTYFF